ncbi:MAG: trigger factor, partial [Firmicutes bacterium]|nr:trigger factor [Bacillota bacterium]
VLSLVLILALCMGLGMTFTGCGEKDPYADGLADFVTLPDYNKYTVKVPNVEITDADIDAKIKENLEAAATTQTVKEGTVAKGDTVVIKFEGVLKDGTSVDGMKSESSTLTLGSGQYIDGFEEGLYGATIGKEVSLDLKFPDPYQNNTDLSGKDVTFKVTVLSKQVKDVPEFNDEFVTKNSDYKNTDEYTAAVAKSLEQEEYDDQLYTIKFDLYSKIVEETVVLKYADGEVEDEAKAVEKEYKTLASNNDMSWDEYLENTLKMTQDEFDEQAEAYAKEIVKQEMIIYAIGEKENLEVTDEEFDSYLESLLTSSGFEDEAAFKAYAGMSLEDYAEAYKLDRDLLLTKELDLIYERLVDAGNVEE